MVRILTISVIVFNGILIVVYINLTHLLQTWIQSTFYTAPSNGSTFDFVVIGSGSSGSVVTGRLVEAGFSVLLVEAGPPSHWMMGAQALATYFLSSLYDWRYPCQISVLYCRPYSRALYLLTKGLTMMKVLIYFSYKSEPSDKVFLGMTDSRTQIPRGKVLGGSSMINSGLNVRGHSLDFDEWSEMGNPGWSFKEVLPFFKKSQTFVGDVVGDKDKYHGSDGPLKVQPMTYNTSMNNILRDAFREKGNQFGDVNGDLENGGFFDTVQVFQVNCHMVQLNNGHFNILYRIKDGVLEATDLLSNPCYRMNNCTSFLAQWPRNYS